MNIETTPATEFKSDAIRASRWAAIDAMMADHGLDALVLSSNDQVLFVGSVQLSAHYWERPFAMIYRPGSAPILLVNQVSQNGLEMQFENGVSWVGDIRCYSEIPRATQRLWTVIQFDRFLAETLETLGLHRAHLGFDSATPLVKRAADRLPGVQLSPVAAALTVLRRVKTEAEIDILRAAAGLGDFAMGRVMAGLSEGRGLQELDATVVSETLTEAARRLPGSNFQIAKLLTLCGAPASSTDGDGVPTGATVARNQPIVSVVVPRLNGFSIEVHRTYFLGEPSAEQATLHRACQAVNEAALGAVVVGQPAFGIDEAAQEAATRLGVYRYLTHRAGHGIGISTHEPPEDVPFNPRPLERNEVLSLEPGLYIPKVAGYRMGDLVIAGDTPEIVTAAPKSLDECVV